MSSCTCRGPINFSCNSHEMSRYKFEVWHTPFSTLVQLHRVYLTFRLTPAAPRLVAANREFWSLEPSALDPTATFFPIIYNIFREPHCTVCHCNSSNIHLKQEIAPRLALIERCHGWSCFGLCRCYSLVPFAWLSGTRVIEHTPAIFQNWLKQ